MIFEHPFFSQMILPFLLVFVTTFAILQKSKILAEGNPQVDAIVAFVLGLILIITPVARNIIVSIMPWAAVGVAVLLVFFILYGFVAGELNSLPNPLKYGLGALAGVFTIGVVLAVTGLGERIISALTRSGSNLLVNIAMILVVVGAVVVAIVGKK